MSILGLIVEYNPFHNGHLHHLKQAQEVTKANTTIAVMSGSFLQRGEPAIVDKWTRAEMAIHHGVDLVVELPTLYATQSADLFAYGAVSTLKCLQVTDIVFGSESNNIEYLNQIASVLIDEPTFFKNLMEINLSLGHSYPKALSLSISEYLNSDKSLNATHIAPLKPNDILGLQYILQNKKLGGQIKIQAINRRLVSYHDQALHDHTIASATAIRKEIFSSNQLSSIKKVVPIKSYELLKREDKQNRLHSWQDFFLSLQTIILNTPHNELKNIHGMTEGLEYRIKDNVLKADSFKDLVELITTKRYTSAKIQRVLLYTLFNLTSDQIKKYQKTQEPAYIRVLGFNDQGRKYLQSIKHQFQTPIITNIKKTHPNLLELDLLASNLYELSFNKSNQKKYDFKQIPIYL